MCCEVSYLYIGLLTQPLYLTYVGFLNNNALLGRDWIHSNWVVPSSLHQVIMFWKDNNSIEIVMADDKPFTICNNVDVMLYNKNMSIVKFASLNNRITDPIIVEHLLEKQVPRVNHQKLFWKKQKGPKLKN